MRPCCVVVFCLVLALANFAFCATSVRPTDASDSEESVCPKIISRAQWHAATPTNVEHLKQNPPPYVVVHHSATNGCNNERSCASLVKSIQTYHKDHQKWGDIGYNFLIGGDGSIFEGRGWGVIGAHTIGYNSRSVGICLLGNFMNAKPSAAQENALKKLISCGVHGNKFQKNYHLIGHRGVSSTLCPGNHLYQFLKKLSHFDGHPTRHT